MKKKNDNLLYVISCYRCGKTIDEQVSHTSCPDCGGPLDVKYDYDAIASRLNSYDLHSADVSARKYLDLLPINDYRKVVSLQEGGTHIYKAEKIGRKFCFKNLYVKNEGVNPTGVFKDRGSFVEITKAVECGAGALIIASSGNMAASCSAYASKADLPIYVLVPEDTPVGKLSQILSYGAHVIKIRGDYSTCVALVDKLAPEHNLYQVGDYVFRREGQKTLAYEIIEQLCYDPPDAVIVPTGAGTHLAGVWKGLIEFKKLGLIKNLPKMIAVQPDGCAVLVEAFAKHKKKFKPWEKADTVCSAVAVTNPMDGEMALEAVYKSKGAIISISDEDTLKAQHLLASEEGIFVEPSSALSIAALPELIKTKIIGGGDRIVCVATGNGLKDPMTPLQKLKPPKTFEADWKAVSRYLSSVHK